jgi:hypothetical protein
MQNLERKLAELANEIIIRDSAIFLIWMTSLSLCRQATFLIYINLVACHHEAYSFTQKGLKKIAQERPVKWNLHFKKGR